MEALAQTVKSAVAAPYTGRKSPSPSRGSAAAAPALEDEGDDLYRKLSGMRIKPAQSKQTRDEFNDLYRQITGEEPSSDKMSDADFQHKLDRILSGRSSPSKFTPEQEKKLDEELDRILNSE